MATNPRIEDLRKRVDKDPGSRLFAQLAEELRKDGELEDAIRVAREGLQKHPNYPSARMTLGRALLDTGDWPAARTEFELVLKSAADNILASRYLAECLENLGDRNGAIARYKATLALAPGDKQAMARLQALEKGTTVGVGAATGGVAAAGAAPVAVRGATPPVSPGARPPTTGLRPASPSPAARPSPPPMSPPMAAPTPTAAPKPAAPPMPLAAPPPAAPPPAAPTPAVVAPTPPVAAAPLSPIPLSTVDGEMELESREGGREPAPPGPATVSVPIPLVPVDEEFELEKPYDIPTTSIGKASAVPAAPTPTAAPTPMAPPTPSVPEAAEDQEFELEAPHEAPSSAWVASIRPLPVPEAPPSVAPTPVAAPTPTAAPPRPPASPAAPTSALISPTLGELYFNQGFTDKAIEVYRELTVQEPGNERLSARLRELEKLQSALAGGEPAPAVPTPTAADSAEAHRRQAIERTIVRLEGLLSAIRKG